MSASTLPDDREVPRHAAPGRADNPSVPDRPTATLDSASLFAGASEVVIAHEGSHYRLRRTSKGKLILTK